MICQSHKPCRSVKHFSSIITTRWRANKLEFIAPLSLSSIKKKKGRTILPSYTFGLSNIRVANCNVIIEICLGFFPSVQSYPKWDWLLQSNTPTNSGHGQMQYWILQIEYSPQITDLKTNIPIKCNSGHGRQNGISDSADGISPDHG